MSGERLARSRFLALATEHIGDHCIRMVLSQSSNQLDGLLIGAIDDDPRNFPQDIQLAHSVGLPAYDQMRFGLIGQ
ncbi:hypothetical protein D3C83_189800 [compost metagenome]